MKVLITGGAGFIGSNVARYFLAQDPNTQVTVLDDLSTGFEENLEGLRVNFVKGTILDASQLADLAVGMDSIVHLAAIPSVPRSIADPRRSHDANTTGTLNVLEAARQVGVPHMVVASSSSVYGSNPVLPKREDAWTRPMSPYAATKLLTEAYAIAYGFSYGLKTTAFRFFNVYGPGQAAGHAYAAVVPQFIDHALRGEPLPIHGDGTQTRDFTFVDTVCAAIFHAVERQLGSESPVNLAFGTNTSLNTLIGLLEGQLGHTLELESHPRRTGDVYASQADGSLLRELFPDLQPVPLEVGLAATVDWFQAQGNRE
ncbi:NAD-dependent epimerase/dehydratase family protein [Diaminobutyricimonas sp. LJ205]|uniref:NAD-dependent epimerase/dehydratase family protein n=1 Tax=Diaminobutyricimonas sp. LJ205 TaxID=2683590 RepID=UPI0012F4A496|nr:NAD-dependent epimerase/dehydratase family protein [Diaminobutyricimonas sp. LJ205]